MLVYLIMIEMISGRTYFLINSRTRPNLLDKNLILLFGTIEYFKEKINSHIPKTTWKDLEGVAMSRFEDSVYIFYYGDEEVIDKFVMVDVVYADEPIKEMLALCSKFNWHLFDLETERYILEV
jgi:hypothetical protein